MMITVKEIDNKNTWEDFLLAQENPSFLQSFNTALQYEAMGDKTLKLGVFKDQKLVGVCLLIVTLAKRGNFLFAPYGPVFAQNKPEYLNELVSFLKKWGKKNNIDFLRFSPYIEKNESNYKLYKNAGFRTSPIHMLGEVIWVLDITPSEEELMKNLRKTTRNLIRRGEKDGVKVTKLTTDESVTEFIKLHEITRKRHHFVPYPDELFYEQVRQFKDDDQVLVFHGKHDNKLIAADIIMYYGKAGSYHHGASIQSKVPVSYYMKWQEILEAKKRGLKEFSFWGIVETEDKKHPFYGITKFKKGFGGKTRYLLPAQDYPLSKKYYLTYIIESIRRIKRGFGLKRS